MGGIVDSVFGGGNDDAADAQRDAAKIAAEQFKPFNINSTLGTAVTRDKSTTFQLSQTFQDLLDQEAGTAQQSTADVARARYDMLSEFAAQDEADARRVTQEGLFRSGRLGTAGGIREIGEVEEALARARLDRQTQAWNFAERQRQNALSNAITLGQLDTSLGGLALNRTPAIVGAGFMNAGNTEAAGAMALQNAIMGPIANQAGSAIGGFAGNALGSLFGPATAAGTVALGASAVPASFGALTAAGSMTAGQAATAAFMASDRRLKTNIKPIGKRGRFEWYEFEFKDPATYGEGLQVGVMADEVEQIEPEAVITMDNGFKAVDYGRIC